MRLFLVIGMGLVAMGCGGSYSVDPKPAGGGANLGGKTGATLGFEAVRTLVFENQAAHCLDCHSNGGGNADGLNLETYANTLARLGRVQAAIQEGSMPLDGSRIGEREIEILNAWVAIGAPETSDVPVPGSEPAPGEPIPPPSVTFSEVNAKIFTPHCSRCHGEFTAYAGAKGSARMILEEVEAGRMPRRGPLEPELQALLRRWVEAGAPEN